MRDKWAESIWRTLVLMSAVLLGATSLMACAPSREAKEAPNQASTTAPAGAAEVATEVRMVATEITPPTGAPTAGVGMTGRGPAMLGTDSSSEYGVYLTDDQGRAVYLRKDDPPGSSGCTDDCAKTWPPVLTAGDPVAGAGVNGMLLGATTRPDGAMQVTYNNHPLYFYSGDAQPGDTKGQEIGEVWYLISAEGEAVEK